MMHRSLRFQLVGWFSLLLVLIMVASGSYTYLRIRSYALKLLSDSLTHRAQQIGQTLLKNATSSGEAYTASEIEARYAPESNDKFIRIIRGDGSVLYHSGEPNDHSFVAAEIPNPRQSISHPIIRQEKVPNHESILIATVPYHSPQDDFLIEVGASVASSNRVANALLWTLAAGQLVVAALAIAGAWVLVNRAFVPVRNITAAAQEITLRRLSRRLPVPDTADEIAKLSVVLNQMIARLDESFQTTTRFTADASHELRTPLTVMRGELETLVARPNLDPVLRDNLASLLEEVERLSRIVGGLLALSRLDAGEAQIERVKFDLANLAETTVEQMCLLADEKHISLQCRTKNLVNVEGDRARVKQAVVNLLDNAIKYTPTNGQVHLSVWAQNGLAFLEVTDSGPGISESALPHVFERFYRADQLNGRDLEGAGLGLSIVQSVATAHGGAVQIENATHGGCRVTISLPRAR